MEPEPRDLSSTPIHLGGTAAEPVPGFDGSPGWFERYAADTDGPAAALFITSGEGTSHRPR